MSNDKKNVKLFLENINVTVTLIDIQIDENDKNILNIEYNYDENCNIDKEIIDKELERVIIEALERSLQKREQKQK